jgi:hypothetical protein
LEDLVHPRTIAAWREAIAAAPEARWLVEVPLPLRKRVGKRV